MDLFEKNTRLKFEMKNRFIRSATHEALATPDGRPTEKLLDLYVKLAKGGVGAIITGFSAIRPDGKCPPGNNMLMIDRDELIDDYKKITDELQKYRCRAILQIVHCGRQTLAEAVGGEKVAPSAIKDKGYPDSIPRELTDNDIEAIIDNFVQATKRAKKAGFDGVQIHGAHGYLLSSFLSNHSNKRKDRWGGSLENRFRIIREIFIRLRNELPDYPVFIKLSAFDFQKDGLNVEETVTICKWLEEVGCDAIEISSGVVEDGFSTMRCSKKPVDAVAHYMAPFNKVKSPIAKVLMKVMVSFMIKNRKPLYNFNCDAATVISDAVSIPVIVVGGIRTLDDMQNILDNTIAEYISLCRPFIMEPSLVKRLEEKKQKEARCIDCGHCMLALGPKPLRCLYGKLV